MKGRIAATLVMLVIFMPLVKSQVTETESKLRTHPNDTINGWKTGGVFSVTLSQTSLTNWISGGQNSFSVNGIFSGFATYRKGKSIWDNSLDLGYGLIKQGNDNRYRKTDDKIDILSKYGREAFDDVYYSFLANFRTQMTPGYNYPDYDHRISDLFAPAYLTIALGLDYKPDTHFSAFVAPVTGKFTFVTDKALSDLGAFGVAPGKNSKSEFGGYLRTIYSKNDFKSEILKNVSFTTKLDLFSNYLDKPQNIDVSWETLITMKVNKYLAFNFNTHLIYDDNVAVPYDKNHDGTVDSGETIRSLVQFKEIFGVGLAYKF
jgi:hypothetical protein